MRSWVLVMAMVLAFGAATSGNAVKADTDGWSLSSLAGACRPVDPADHFRVAVADEMPTEHVIDTRDSTTLPHDASYRKRCPHDWPKTESLFRLAWHHDDAGVRTSVDVTRFDHGGPGG